MSFARNFLTTSAAVALSAFVVHGSAVAETAAEFYKGKTITAIVASGPDSTFAVYSRIVAPFLEKYTGAKVVIQPMPGGGGYLARNFIYEAKPDGLTLNLNGHGPKVVTGGMFQLEGVRYDWKKFTPIAQVIHSKVYVMIGKDSKANKPADLVNTAFNTGESSPFFGPQVAEALGFKKLTVIPGFRSTAARAAAIARGEIQMTVASKEVFVNHPDAVKPIAVSAKDPGHPELPVMTEIASAEGKRWAEYIDGWTNLLNMIYGPPGIPEDRAAFLESALEKTYNDPEFQKGLDKLNGTRPDEFVSRAKLKAIMSNLASLNDEQVKEMKFVITEKYKKKK